MVTALTLGSFLAFLRRHGRFCATMTMDTSEAIFAFLSRFYANLSQFEDYCRLFEEFRERLWRERENLAIFALILGQKLPVWPPAGSQSYRRFGGGSPPPQEFFLGGGPSELAPPPQPLPNLGGHETLHTLSHILERKSCAIRLELRSSLHFFSWSRALACNPVQPSAILV